MLSHGPCELHYAQLTADAAVADVTLYDGENASGKKIFTLKTLVAVSQQADLTKPVYCEHGLYVDIGAGVLGAFIMWRNL